MSENLVKNRSEILFIYDVKDANPNGDPLDENKPRVDEETGANIVTDVRLKRTIRDYLHDYKGKEVFVIEQRKDDKNLKTKEERLREFECDPNKVLEECIDIRLFGATTAVEKNTMAITGPVQFKFGRSLHKVDISYIKGTTVMPSGSEKKQGTFTERYILPYSLIVFYGVVNENAAKNQHIKLTTEDINLMLEAIWNGTKNLISGSKFGQMPRLLMQVIHKAGNYYIGELDKYVRLKSDKSDESIRDISDFKLDVTELINVLDRNKEKIERIRLKIDDRVQFGNDKQKIEIKTSLAELNINIEEIKF